MSAKESSLNNWEIESPEIYLDQFTLALNRLLSEGITPEPIATNGDVVLACGTGNRPLAIATAATYLEKFGKGSFQDTMQPLDEHIFSDGERFPSYCEPLLRKNVYIIHSCTPKRTLANGEADPTSGINEQLMELLLMIDGAKRANAQEIHLILPYLPYLRQDKKNGSGQPVGASLLMRMIKEAGASSLFVLDPHNEQVCFTFPEAIDIAYASYVFKDVVRSEIGIDNLVVLAPDVGAYKRAAKYADILAEDSPIPFGAIGKTRKFDGSIVSEAALRIDVAGKDVIIVDDIAATCGALTTQSQVAKDAGAKRIFAVVTHGLFTGPAVERITNSPIDGIFVTNSVSHHREVWENVNQKEGKIRVVDLSEYLADVINHHYTGESFNDFYFD